MTGSPGGFFRVSTVMVGVIVGLFLDPCLTNSIGRGGSPGYCFRCHARNDVFIHLLSSLRLRPPNLLTLPLGPFGGGSLDTRSKCHAPMCFPRSLSSKFVSSGDINLQFFSRNVGGMDRHMQLLNPQLCVSLPPLSPLRGSFNGLSSGVDEIVDKTLPRDFALILRGLYDLSSGFDAIEEHTGDDHDRNMIVPFGGKPPGSEGPGRNCLPTVPFDDKTIGGAIWAAKPPARGHVYLSERGAVISPQAGTYEYPFLAVGAAQVSHPTALEKSAYRRMSIPSYADYPKIEAEAKALAEELGISYAWNKIDFREAAEKDHEKIQAALKDEESIPTNSDWAVKLGINLYYSASLSKSPLYSKQMPYNAVIYKSFSCNSPNSSAGKTKNSGRKPGRQKKIVVAGKWCGKVWMSNQVHPYLAQRKDAQDEEEEEGPFMRGGITNPNSVIGSESKGSSANDSSSTSREPKKRKKKPMQKSNEKRQRLNQSNNLLKAIEDDDKISQKNKGRILRSSHRLKHKDETDGGPSSRLRKRPMKSDETKIVKPSYKKPNESRTKGGMPPKSNDDEGEYTCDIDGCSLSFGTKQELSLHKRDICPVKGCGKKLFSHKYMMQHRKVHMDDRPLECPWKGCKMTFKWAWARTEHIRVHTGDRPYICREPGCGQTFRFVSDFSRHKRKTNHSAKKLRRS
ncbi:hypothetical protein M5K25_010865 [Dendrobium thyrsiflorum]|uniref:C2H2-type domain-containing protein n=1 Tax=Dendrobium thyrsiflorum TaxID=117978 RepID=A0ABD0V1E0_DENTH